MSETDAAEMIGRRSELLARVVLTRRLNIDVHPFSDTADAGIDLICTIRPDPDDEVHGFLPFGVIVWGTAKELATADKATKYARSRRKARSPKTQYYMPVIVLLFSMQKDESYFSWLVKPGQDSNKLLDLTELDFTLFDNRQFDKMVNTIKKWYRRLTTTIVADASEIAMSHSSEDK
jgi:hypothetical protein